MVRKYAKRNYVPAPRKTTSFRPLKLAPKVSAKDVISVLDFVAKQIPKRKPTKTTTQVKKPFKSGKGKGWVGKTGKYVGKFKPKSKLVDNSWNLSGSVLRIENSGIHTSSECAYIGHSTIAPKKVYEQLARLVIKELMAQCGRPIQSWSELYGEYNLANCSHKIQYEYFGSSGSLSSDENPVPAQREIDVNPTDSFETIATALYTDWTALTSRGKYYFNFIDLRQTSTTISNVFDIKARIYAPQFFISISSSSCMKIQNITGARLTGDTSDDYMTTNMNSNPLAYKSYDRYSQNGFRYTYMRNLGGSTATNFIANDSSGVIKYDPVVHTLKALYHPPLHSALVAASKKKFISKSAKGVLNPGDIKKSSLKFFKTVSFNTLFNLLTDSLPDAFNYIVSLGNARVFGFEHLIKNAADPDVQLSYEVDIVLRMKSKYKRKIATEDIVEITNA